MSDAHEAGKIDFARATDEEKIAWDEYAAAAISGRLAGRDGTGSTGAIVSKAAAIADAMLLERMNRF